MRSFSTPLPLTTGLAPLPLASTGSVPIGGPVAATVATSSKPLPLPGTSAAGAMPVAAPATLSSAQFPHVASAGLCVLYSSRGSITSGRDLMLQLLRGGDLGQAIASSGTATGASPAKKTPGSGQQMFQQMFALLKQMLPAEQYATLHSEMRKGNGVSSLRVDSPVLWNALAHVALLARLRMISSRSWTSSSASPATRSSPASSRKWI